MDDFLDQESVDKISQLWDKFHKVVADLNEEEYSHLEIAGLMQAYALKLYRMKLTDDEDRGMLNYIFLQHNRIMEDNESKTLH